MKLKSLPAIFGLIILLAVFASSIVLADKNPEMKTVKGHLTCLGCSLKSEAGARAMCSKYGCESAFKTADGKMWHFLKNDKSSDLIDNHDLMGMEASVTGYFHENSLTIDLASYDIGEKKISWCEGHGKMDACMAEKHKGHKH